MTTQPWISLNRDASATAGAVQLFEALKAAGAVPINLGQGREIDAPPEDIRPHWQGKSDTAYNTEVGGPAATREAMADFLGRFYGMPADANNTFVLQAQGRSGLARILAILTRRHIQFNDFRIPLVGIQDLHWPMYADVIKHSGQHPVVLSELHKDSMPPPSFFASIENDPNNPTGAMKTLAEHQALRDKDKKEVPESIQHYRIYDMPYGYAGLPREGDNYIGPDYAQFISKEESSVRPWAIVVSFSKSDAMAQPGLCVIVVHPSLIKDMKTILTTDGGLSYDHGLMDALPNAFGEDADAVRLDHYAALRAKYTTNRHCMEALNFPLLPGAPCMTAALDVTELLGKRVATESFGSHDVATVQDLVELLANAAGVVTVAQNQTILRVALAQKPEQFEQGAKRLNQIFAQLRDASRLVP